MKASMARLSLFLLGLVLPSSLFAAQVTESAPSSIPDFDDMEYGELIREFQKERGRWARESCEFGVPILTAMSRKNPDNDPVENLRLLAQVLCANERNDYAEAAQVLKTLETNFPDQHYNDLGFLLAVRTESAEDALARLRSLDFDQAKDLSEDTLWSVSRMLTRAGRNTELNDVALDWSQNGIFGALSRDQQSGMAFRALDAAVRQERIEAVDGLLTYVTNPQSYVTLLTDRKYETIWPKIEARAGPNMSLVGQEDVMLKLARLENNELDRDRFSAAARALHFNGQFEDAIELADQWRSREEGGSAIEEGDAWALNIQAYAYDSLGQTEKADAIFDRLAEVDASKHSWAVNFVINRAARLVGQGRWTEGLEAAELARSVPGSTYAELIVARDFTCALKKLGRIEESEKELPFLRENAEDGLAMSVQGLMCHDLNSEAAQILSDALANPITRDRAIAAFEVDELDLFYTQSILPDARDLLADFPDLAQQLATYVRPMPEEYVPTASLKRVTLDLPSWE